MLERIAKVFAEVFGCDVNSVTVDTVPGNIPKWDSLGHITMVSAIEKEFNVSLDAMEMMEMSSVSEIIRILSSK